MNKQERELLETWSRTVSNSLESIARALEVLDERLDRVEDVLPEMVETEKKIAEALTMLASSLSRR